MATRVGGPLHRDAREARSVCARVALTILAVCVGALAHAGDCWVGTVNNADTGNGDAFSAGRYTAERRILDAAEAALRSDAAIGTMADVRYRIHRYIGTSAHPRAPLSADVYVMLHRPDAWDGRCGLKPWADNVHFASLSVRINSLQMLAGQQAGETDAGGEAFFVAPRVTGHRAGYPIYEGRVLVMTERGIEPFVAVTVGEYLDEWRRRLERERAQAQSDGRALAEDAEWKAYVKQVRATDPALAAEIEHGLDEAARLTTDGGSVLADEWAALESLRKSLPAGERLRPAYVSSAALERHRFGYAAAADVGAWALVRINPALWADVRAEHDVRVLALEVFVNRSETFEAADDTHQAAARAWLEQVDTRPYRALLAY